MNKKILIIEEKKVFGDVLSRCFAEEGHMISVVPQYLQGLESVAREKPDVVLMHVTRPGQDEMDALARIKGNNADTDVILVTGYGNLETAVEAMKLGAVDYITEPFDLEYIKNLIVQCLEK